MLSKGCYESLEIQEKRAGRVSFCTGANVTEKSSAGKGWWASGQSLGVDGRTGWCSWTWAQAARCKPAGGELRAAWVQSSRGSASLEDTGCSQHQALSQHGGKGRHLGSTCFPDGCSRRCSTLLKQRDVAKLKKGAGMLCTYLHVKVLTHTSIHTQCCCETW